jgi:glycosyltransferase involved in cell wall biosynthesis
MNKFPNNWKSKNVTLSHDWLTGMRGGERVLEILCDGFPKAPVYTLFRNPANISEKINSHPIWTSYLQSFPGITKYYKNLLPLFPCAIQLMRPDRADLLISTSHCVAKALPHDKSCRHLCYCFTPMRYAWMFFDEYFGNKPVFGTMIKPILALLRKWDKRTAGSVDAFVAISEHVRQRIKDFYGRDSDVVYPPVDTSIWTPSEGISTDKYDLVVSALVPYKRVDLAVKAANKTGFPLKIVGTGNEYNTIQPIAGKHIEFLGHKSDAEILELYRNCRMLIFPGEEDFGIVPVEAQSCGKPVVAFAKGGALESIVDEKTGIFFKEQTTESLVTAIEKCAATKWDSGAIRSHAMKFDTQVFIDNLDKVITRLTAQ